MGLALAALAQVGVASAIVEWGTRAQQERWLPAFGERFVPAALAVLDWHDETDICAKLAAIGREMRAAVERAIRSTGARGVRTDGVDAMWLLQWDDPARENRFVREALGAGVLFKRGAYNFAAIAHDEEALVAVEQAASTALTAMREDTD